MRVSRKTDFALMALVEIAAAHEAHPDALVSASAIAGLQDIESTYLLVILSDLQRAGIVTSRRGKMGGWRLARRAADIHVADVIRAVDGALMTVGGRSPEELPYAGRATAIRDLWISSRQILDRAFDSVSLADLLATPALEGVGVGAAGEWDLGHTTRFIDNV